VTVAAVWSSFQPFCCPISAQFKDQAFTATSSHHHLLLASVLHRLPSLSDHFSGELKKEKEKENPLFGFFFFFFLLHILL
jgi:hypothetical protein